MNVENIINQLERFESICPRLEDPIKSSEIPSNKPTKYPSKHPVQPIEQEIILIVP